MVHLAQTIGVANPASRLVATRGVRQDDFEARARHHGFVGANFVESLPFGMPASLAELEQRCRMTPGDLGIVIEWAGIKMNRDHGEESARLAIAGPKDLVMPVGFLPAHPSRRLDSAQST